jgi:decaprenylphospho-beta-D-ribofuranose 2-oxidase
MTATLTGTTTSLTGWGRTDPSSALVCVPSTVNQIQSTVAAATPGSLIARGLGRAYGNPAQCGGGTVLELTGLDAIQLDAASGCVVAGAGASVDGLLRVIVPAGFFLPVTPGTRNVTVGGAIAADVHGKNHHGEGSFANHVHWLKLVDGSGQLRQLSPNDPATAAAFWATAGGMGLTGVIVEACFRLIPISSSLISVDTTRFRDFDALMAAMVEADARYRYSVAWVDSLNPAGRGVLTCGDHASREQVEGSGGDPLHYDPKALAGAPSLLPGGLLNTWTVRAFNEAWYRRLAPTSTPSMG